MTTAPGVTVTDCMMTDGERVEAVTLARSVFASPVVGELNLLAIWGLEQSATVERFERELQRLRLEVAIANGRAAKLRAAILEGAKDAAQASALQTAITTVEEGVWSDAGVAAVPMASVLLAMHEDLKWACGVIRAAGNVIDEDVLARAGAR